MPKLPIVQAGIPILRERAREVEPSFIRTQVFADLIDVVAATMRDAPGVGLAAPQIGVPLRIIVLEDADRLMRSLGKDEREQRGRMAFDLEVFVNPVLRPLSEKTATYYEGCLSVPGYQAEVTRYLDVEVTGLDRKGNPKTWQVSGWPARILQHEVDHLTGTLYVDRMNTRTFSTHAAREDLSREQFLARIRDAEL